MASSHKLNVMSLASTVHRHVSAGVPWLTFADDVKSGSLKDREKAVDGELSAYENLSINTLPSIYNQRMPEMAVCGELSR